MEGTQRIRPGAKPLVREMSAEQFDQRVAAQTAAATKG
ncbi:MAG: hypothetical protein JWP20_415 [Roseomonas sp.]|nr:hypothetical protein [Roseomonas sp.]